MIDRYIREETLEIESLKPFTDISIYEYGLIVCKLYATREGREQLRTNHKIPHELICDMMSFPEDLKLRIFSAIRPKKNWVRPPAVNTHSSNEEKAIYLYFRLMDMYPIDHGVALLHAVNQLRASVNLPAIEAGIPNEELYDEYHQLVLDVSFN